MRRRNRRSGLARIAVVAGLAFGLTAASAAAQDFDDGLSAYDVGDYAGAFANWWPLSLRGNAKAQAALGFLYYNGLGVRLDIDAAALWFRRAADAGQPTAQAYLGILYLQGRGVDQDFARAYMWCDMAVSTGFDSALSCREAAALNMSTDDFKRSTRMTVEWRRSQETTE